MNNYIRKISSPDLSLDSLRNGFLFIIILLLYSHVFSNNTTPQNQKIIFDSDSIEALYGILPENIKTGIACLNTNASPSILKTEFQDDTLQLNIRFNTYNELSHIGIFIFLVEDEDHYYNKVFDFIEREILRYHILRADTQILERMKVTEVGLYMNGDDYQKSHYSSMLPVFSFLKDMPFILNANDNEYSITWKLNSAESLTMHFPNNYLIISGKRKDEIEKEIARELKNLSRQSASINIAIHQDMNDPSNRIVTVKGENYEDSNEISSDTYYYTDSEIPVFDTVNVNESLSNLFLNLIPNNIDLNITHILYGNITDQYIININDFLNYFAKEHKVYCVVNDSIKNNIQVSIFVYNVPFRYVHLLTINTSLNNMVNHTNMNGMLYTFIRKDNVKN